MSARTPDDYEREGRRWLLHRDPDTALKVFREGLAKFAGDELLLLGVAMAHIDMGDFVKACEVLAPLRAKHPTWGDIRQGLAEAYLRLGQKQKALECIREAVGDHERDAAFVNALGGLLFDHQFYQEALRLHDKALTLDPNLAFAHMGRCTCLHRLGNIPEAIAAARKAVACAPDYFEAVSYLGNLLYDEGQKEEAKAVFLRIPTEKLADATTVKRLLVLSKGPADAAQRKALRARLKQVDWLREMLKGEQKASRIVRKLEDRMDQASLARHPKRKVEFWRGMLTVLAGSVQEEGHALNGLLAKMFEKPVRFEDGRNPEWIRFDKHLGEKYLIGLAALLDAYPWRMARENWRVPMKPEPLGPGQQETQEDILQRQNLFDWVDFCSLVFFGKAVVGEMRRRLNKKVLPQVAIVRLREAMERLKPHVPAKSRHYEAWLQLRAALEPQ